MTFFLPPGIKGLSVYVNIMTTRQKSMENKLEELIWRGLYQRKSNKSGCEIQGNMLLAIGRSKNWNREGSQNREDRIRQGYVSKTNSRTQKIEY